jgi:hypothetical protein
MVTDRQTDAYRKHKLCYFLGYAEQQPVQAIAVMLSK